MKRICPFCKKEFETDNKQKVYCSPLCAKKNQRNRKRERINAEKVALIVHHESEKLKESLCYHGTGNSNITCSRCKFGCIAHETNGHICDSGHYCKKHKFTIGEFGTCKDFTSPITATAYDPFESV